MVDTPGSVRFRMNVQPNVIALSWVSKFAIVGTSPPVGRVKKHMASAIPLARIVAAAVVVNRGITSHFVSIEVSTLIPQLDAFGGEGDGDKSKSNESCLHFVVLRLMVKFGNWMAFYRNLDAVACKSQMRKRG